MSIANFFYGFKHGLPRGRRGDRITSFWISDYDARMCFWKFKGRLIAAWVKGENNIQYLLIRQPCQLRGKVFLSRANAILSGYGLGSIGSTGKSLIFYFGSNQSTPWRGRMLFRLGHPPSLSGSTEEYFRSLFSRYRIDSCEQWKSFLTPASSFPVSVLPSTTSLTAPGTTVS